MRLTIARSLQLLAEAQTPTGAIPASTVHDVNQYGWLRDGSWCAHAFDRASRSDSAAACHHWVAKTLLAHRHRFDEAIARLTGRITTLAGAFVRFPGDSRIDGSLLWLAVPFGVVAIDDPLYRNTVTRIREELVVSGGGVRRYLGDTFYGGSEWILLAATLGWVGLDQDDPESASRMLAWVEAAADEDGVPARAGSRPRPVAVHARPLAAKVGRDRDTPVVVTRDTRRTRQPTRSADRPIRQLVDRAH